MLFINFFKKFHEKSEVHRILSIKILSRIEEFEGSSNVGEGVSAQCLCGALYRAAVGEPCQLW